MSVMLTRSHGLLGAELLAMFLVYISEMKMHLETISSTGGQIVYLLNLANIFVGLKMYQSAKNIRLKLVLHKFHIIFAVIYKDYYLSNMDDKDSGANSQNYRETNSSGWGRVGNFRPKNFSAEVGIDGTIGLFRRNSGCSAEQKILGFRS
jgi:hypothetical protein